MRIDFLREPELEFGAGRHIDIRFGLMDYGPLDFGRALAPKEIKVGVVGTQSTIDGVLAWLDRCMQGLPAKPSKQPNLFPHFPGFGTDSPFRACLVTSAQLQRPISQREFDTLKRHSNPDRIIAEAVDILMRELTYLADTVPVDVILCALPMELLEITEGKEAGDDDQTEDSDEEFIHLNLRHMLKARAMRLRKPIQIVLPPTYDESKKRKSKRKDTTRTLQDEATRAWNFHTALYYKAGGIPWRLVREASDYLTCYVGISFYRSLDGERLQTSVAQVFNERGEGIIVRGGAAKMAKEDRRPYLEADDAYSLLTGALSRYRAEHHTMPARIVLHKSSKFRTEELDGFDRAASDQKIDFVDFVSMRKWATRLFRVGLYPPLRGTLLSLDDKSHVLYTRGSIGFYETYPGMYVPTPLKLYFDRTDRSARDHGTEILAMTKMNWNDTQFDGSYPITQEAAHHVGDVLKYLTEDEPMEARYSFYM